MDGIVGLVLERQTNKIKEKWGLTIDFYFLE